MPNKFIRTICTVIYYCIATHLPDSYAPVIGKPCNALRVMLVKGIFAKCGKINTINRKAYFGKGDQIEIGDFSGIGAYCRVPSNLKMGKYIMMAPRVIIHSNNHITDDISCPMIFQGTTPRKQNIIEDDVWIGSDVIITPGVTIAKGSIVASGSVVTKSFGEYAVIGGNPAKVIKYRTDQRMSPMPFMRICKK